MNSVDCEIDQSFVGTAVFECGRSAPAKRSKPIGRAIGRQQRPDRLRERFGIQRIEVEGRFSA
jgi:hypothetical protein